MKITLKESIGKITLQENVGKHAQQAHISEFSLHESKVTTTLLENSGEDYSEEKQANIAL